MTEIEYANIRAKRNCLRDEFNQETCFLKANKLKKQIKELDIKLQEYEKKFII